MSNTSLTQVQSSAQYPTQYTIEPSQSPDVWAGVVRCIAVYPDRPACLADYDAVMSVRNNGTIEINSRHAAFPVADVSFTKYGAILSGYAPFVLGEETDGKPIIGWHYQQVGVSKTAYLLAALYGETVKELAGGIKTPLPPMPPIVDLWSQDIPFSVVVA